MRLATAAALVALAAAPAEAQLTARFIDGTYTIGGADCAKLKALARGAPRNLNSVPWTLEPKGFASWEGGCGWTKITEIKPGQEWTLEADCQEAADESKERYHLRRSSPTTFTVTLTTPGASAPDRRPRVYRKCVVR